MAARDPTLDWWAPLPRKPYCTDDLAAGLVVRVRRLALRYGYIQFNPAGLCYWLLFDLDSPEAALAWEDCNLPPPTVLIVNPDNGHAHLAYLLTAPVPTTEAARTHPVRYLAAIEEGYRQRLGADPGYSGLIVKNPDHPRWQATWWNQTYTLAELAARLDPEDMRRPPAREPGETSGLGRNCALFDRLGPGGKWAYREVRNYWGGPRKAWEERVLAQALEWNTEFMAPLHHTEVGHLAGSVAKFCWNKLTPAGLRELIARTHTPELQAARGRKGGAASGAARRQRAEGQRRLVLELVGQGLGPTEIAARAGLSRRTIHHYLTRQEDDE